MKMQLDISRITRNHPAWMYLWPIQSDGQFVSILVSAIVGLVMVGGIGHLLSPMMPLAPLFAVALAGASVPVYSVLPGTLKVTSNGGASQIRVIVERHLVTSSYVLSEHGKAAARYRATGPRWLRWEENVVCIHVRDVSTLDIEGPVLALYGIRQWLKQGRW